MQIYPTMELLDGHCVTLEKGRLDDPLVWHVDPIAKAREFAACGAEWMHLTDFNAVQGDDSNQDLVKEIIRTAGIPVQLGGGMRSRARRSRPARRGSRDALSRRPRTSEAAVWHSSMAG